MAVVSVHLSVTVVSPAKVAEQIEMLFGVCTQIGPGMHCMYYIGSHWQHLANTTEPSICGGNVALCQITLTTCYHYYYYSYYYY